MRKENMHKVRLNVMTEAVQFTTNGNPNPSLRQGKGAFPAYVPRPAAMVCPPAPQVHPGSVSGTLLPEPSILAIDDSLTIRKIVETTLRREGYSCQTFPDGFAVFQWLLARNAPVPQLVLLDIGLPKLDGYEIARMFKAKPAFENTTIIMMSCRDGMVDRLKGRLVGAKAYLAKPFTVQALVETVRQYLGSKAGGKIR